MKRLILMRHAKSRREAPDGHDHGRGLSDRGRAAARLVGDWLRRQGHVPDQALVSDATRARETFKRLELPCAAAFLPTLYLAEAEAMLPVLRQASGACVLMIGHNPGIGELARQLLAAPPPHPRFRDYPTGATLVAAFDIAAWRMLDAGTGRVVDFITPRDLGG
ncbi:MAG: histidine phosphatase family protein [Roseovarius sp.]